MGYGARCLSRGHEVAAAKRIFLPLMSDVFPFDNDYLQATDRDIPLVILERTDEDRGHRWAPAIPSSVPGCVTRVYFGACRIGFRSAKGASDGPAVQ